MGVLKVEVHDAGLADEGELGGGHNHNGRGVTAEELRFHSVEVHFEVYEFVGGAEGHLAHELVNGRLPVILMLPPAPAPKVRTVHCWPWPKRIWLMKLAQMLRLLTGGRLAGRCCWWLAIGGRWR